MMCKYGGLKTLRHSRLVAALRAILREAGATVSPQEEIVHAWRRADGKEARLDVVFSFDGCRRYVDVALRHPCAACYMAAASECDGGALRAEVILLNTCSVREKAAQKVYSRLGEVKKRKRAHPDFLIGVVGKWLWHRLMKRRSLFLPSTLFRVTGICHERCIRSRQNFGMNHVLEGG